jgi:chromosome segregation ATPase
MSSPQSGAAPRDGPAASIPPEVLERIRGLTAQLLAEENGPALLGAILQGIRLRHGALLRYDSDSQSLALLAHEGLASQAVEALQVVRRGASGVWDMPLHAVLQRRVYIIDRPKENPFVPPLLQGSEVGLLTNAAVMPLFASGLVTGALLLVASGKRAIREPDILALRDVAKMVGAALRLPPKAPARPSAALPPPAASGARDEAVRDRAMLTARISELESQVESLRRAADAAAASGEAERRVAEVARERDRYKSEAALHELASRNLRSEIELLREQGTGEVERGRKLAVDLARAKEELAAAAQAGQRSIEELEKTERARSELVQRLTALEQRFAESTTQVRAGEASRSDLESRLTAVERDGEELRKTLRARDEQIADLRGERERLNAALQKAAARHRAAEDASSQLGESTEIAQAELRGQIESLQARVETAERERDRLSAGLAGREEIVREIERETEKYRAELAREIERRRVAEQTFSSVIQDAAALRAEAERNQGERQAASAEAERSQLEARRLATELEELRKSSQAEKKQLRQRSAALEKRATEAESARTALSADIERLRPELESLRAAEEELRKRDEARDESERRRSAETSELRQGLETANESVRALTRERDSLMARVATLEETTANLMRDAEALRAEHDARGRELETARSAIETRSGETERLRVDAERLRALAQQSDATLASVRAEQTSAVEQARALEREIAALRADLERAQSQGSELTADLARSAQREESLRAEIAEARLVREEAERRRLEEELARKELQAREQELEQALQGASADLAEKARQVDFGTVLRATLAKSEAARRTAEDAVSRLEATLESEREAAARAQGEAEHEREAAGDLARRVEEIERKLAESEGAAAAAEERAEVLAAEGAAAQETIQALAADLGRRTAEVNELSARLEARQREIAETESAIEQSRARAQSLEAGARAASEEIDTLRRQTVATQDEKDRQIHELEVRIAESTARNERWAAESKAGDDEREKLRETVEALEGQRRQATEQLQDAAAKAIELETAARRAQEEIERAGEELANAQQRSASLESDLQGLEAESERWRALAEKLQSTIEERDLELQALKSGPRPVAPERPVPPRPVAIRPIPVAKPTAPPPPERVITSRKIVVLDEPGPSLNAFAQACDSGGFQAHALENGTGPGDPPGYTAVNLLAAKIGGLEGLLRSRTEEALASSALLLYATKPGSAKGVVFPAVECLIRPFEEPTFVTALSNLLGNGKRVTIIGEELDSVLKLNAWATAKGCSVSSAGDLKQGNEILDIVKPDLIVFDFSRLGGEGAGLFVKARRSARLESLPLLLVLPAGAQSASAGIFLKRLAALADETPLDFSPMVRRLAPANAA